MSLAGIIAKPCVEFSHDPNDLEPHSASQSGHLAITQTSSSESLASALQLSVGASFSFGIYSGDLSARYAESEKFSRYSESLVIDTYVEKERRLIKNVKLSKVGEAARKKGQVQFFLTCGDEFIDGYIQGGVFTAIFTVTTSSNEQQRNASATLHAAASGLSGNGKIDASVESSMQSLATAGNLTYDVTRKGPEESFPKPTVKDLIDYALQFPTKINGHEWTVKYSTSDYSGIVDWPLMTPTQRQVSNKLAAYVRQLYYRRAGLKYINANQKIFPPFDSDRLQNEIQGLDAEIQNVSDLALGCISTRNCNEPQYRTIAPLPPRLDDAIKIDPSRNEWKFIGASIGGETKVVVTEGMWYARCDEQGKKLLPQHPGDSDSYRFVNIKTGVETLTKAAKPTLVPPNSYVYYKVFDGPTDYFDNCSPDGLKVNIFQPLYADEYKPGTTLNAATLAQITNKLAASTTQVMTETKAVSKPKARHAPKTDISLPVR